MAVNVVELMTAGSDDCAFDQPCKFGHRVEGHAVYCHNDAWEDGPRKCRRTWSTGGELKDEDCPGFQPNAEFKGALNPSPIATPICSACKGRRLKATDRDRYETCPHCVGEGSEPQAMELSTFQQDTLEIGFSLTGGLSGRDPILGERFMRVAETREHADQVMAMDELGLVEVRTIAHAKGGVTAFLLETTGKGNAVMHANWKAKRNGDA